MTVVRPHPSTAASDLDAGLFAIAGLAVIWLAYLLVREGVRPPGSGATSAAGGRAVARGDRTPTTSRYSTIQISEIAGAMPRKMWICLARSGSRKATTTS